MGTYTCRHMPSTSGATIVARAGMWGLGQRRLRLRQPGCGWPLALLRRSTTARDPTPAGGASGEGTIAGLCGGRDRYFLAPWGSRVVREPSETVGWGWASGADDENFFIWRPAQTFEMEK